MANDSFFTCVNGIDEIYEKIVNDKAKYKLVLSIEK